MEVAIWDTYVTRQNGLIMHFDIIVPVETSEEKVIDFGRKYLKIKNETDGLLSSNECNWCHNEIADPLITEAITTNGYFIAEITGCS